MLRSTFQLVPGLGPTRERALWAAGLTDWRDLPAPAGLLPARLGPALARAAEAADAALAARDLPALAAALPARERWRLFAAFPDEAVFLDIEADLEEVTAVGLLDRDGPRILLAGRDLDRFPQAVPPNALLVTFNGAAFDVPALRRTFPDWIPPQAHIDLRALWNRLGHWGGLKALEDEVGIGRPEHLRGLDGSRAAWLWRHARHGDRRALRLFAEYNLYDTINLRTLMALGYNRLAEASGLLTAPLPVSFRGDVLYDVSKALLALG
jgi:hypothetical protein